MKNMFINLPKEELLKLYELYEEWKKNGVLSNNELRTYGDKYLDKNWDIGLQIMELHLLQAIAKNWSTDNSR